MNALPGEKAKAEFRGLRTMSGKPVNFLVLPLEYQ